MFKKILALSFLITGIQYLAYQWMDPLAFSDTTRYFQLADFFKAPGVSHVGDLAYNNGLLYTPLFLPGFLFLSNQFLHLSYLFSGGLLQVMSFLAILGLSFSIAFHLAGRKTAWLTLILLLTHAIYAIESVRIATEYPYTVLLLGIVYCVLRRDTLDRSQAWILSLLSAGLVALRTQGMILVIILALYLILSGKMRPKLLIAFFSLPLAYLLFYFLFFLHLDSKYPLTLMLNESFTLRLFLSDPYGLRYDLAAHGLNPAGFLFRSIGERLHNYIAPENLPAVTYNGAFFLALLIAASCSQLRQKWLLLVLIFGHGLVTLAGLPPYYVLIRYQTAFFPLCLIVLADHFVQESENWRKESYRLRPTAMLFLCSLMLYGAYFFMWHLDYFKTLREGSCEAQLVPRETAEQRSAFIQNKIGTGKKIVAANVMQYGIILRSGNIPLYGNFSWGRKELTDYLKIHGTHFLLCDSETLAYFKNAGMATQDVYPFPPEILRTDETLVLAVFND